MKSVPVLLITHDDLLWQRWRELDPERWLVARGRGLADLQRWRDQGRSLAVLDADLPRLPSWQDAAWAQTLAGLSLLVASARRHQNSGTKAAGLGPGGLSTGGIWMAAGQPPAAPGGREGQDAGDWDGGLLTERETTAARYAPAAGAMPKSPRRWASPNAPSRPICRRFRETGRVRPPAVGAAGARHLLA